jgi:uncharacterized membrane protein YjfL (UPF0719 family)
MPRFLLVVLGLWVGLPGLTGAEAVATAAAAAQPEAHSPWIDVLGSLGGLVLGFVQLVVGLGVASYAITKGLALLSHLLGGLDLWAEIRKRNVGVALLGAGAVISYCMVISGGITSITSALVMLGSNPLDGLLALISGILNLTLSILLAPVAITVVFRVMDRLTRGLDEKAEFAAGNPAIGVIYCGILIGVAGLVASGVGGMSAAILNLLKALRQALLG